MAYREMERSYSPGSRWYWPISELRTPDQDKARSAEMVSALRVSHPDLFKNL